MTKYMLFGTQYYFGIALLFLRFLRIFAAILFIVRQGERLNMQAQIDRYPSPHLGPHPAGWG